MHTDRCGNTRGQKYRAKGSGTEAKIHELCIEIQRMWNLKCEIIPVITGATGIVTKGLKEEFGIHTRKKFNRFNTKGSYIWNITYHTGSKTVRNLKPERRGSPLVQEKYKGERPVTRDDDNNKNIIIIIMVKNEVNIILFLFSKVMTYSWQSFKQDRQCACNKVVAH